MGNLAKYDHQKIENKWYSYWTDNNYFSSKPDSREPYTIVIPPPNITGVLHMGHMLNNTIQDIQIRKARMEGKEACWIPGTDHASIATETKVVGMLQERGINKQDLSREEFLKYAWDWKEKYGGIIIKQLKRLGCSCDWNRERFTMDDGYTKAVLTAFVKLYEKGKLRQDIVDIMQANSRLPGSLYGDLNGQINALELGLNRINELLDEYSDDVVLNAMSELRRRANKLMQSYIGELPDGVYQAIDWLDNDGIIDKPLKLALSIRVAGKELTLDFSGSSPACLGPVNISRSTTIAACYVAMKHVFPEVPANSGVLASR